MRALVFDGSVRFDGNRPEPDKAEGDTLIRVFHAGICATDLEIARGYMQYQGILGHEFVGRVESSPDASLIGKRIVGEINIVCGVCDRCRSGLSSHCAGRSVLGILNHPGAFADYVRLPSINCHLIPDSLDNDHAVFVEPLAAAFQVLRQVAIDSRTWVTILGDGKLGLLVAQVLRNAGAPVRVLGHYPSKLALCEKWSIAARPLADTKPRNDQDVVIDCTGSADGLELAMQFVRPRGTIVLKTTAATAKPLNLAPIVVDEVTIIGSRCGPFREAIGALARREIDVVSLIHRRLKLEQGEEAMNLAGQRGIMKVLLAVN